MNRSFTFFKLRLSYLLSILALIIIISGCQNDDELSLAPEDSRVEIIRSESQYEHFLTTRGIASENPYLEIIGACIEQNQLNITLESSLDCESLQFQIIWRGKAEENSPDTPLVNLLIRKVSNIVDCVTPTTQERIELNIDLQTLLGDNIANNTPRIHLLNLSSTQNISPYTNACNAYSLAKVNINPNDENCALTLNLENGTSLNVVENQATGFQFYQNQQLRINYDLLAGQSTCGAYDTRLNKAVDVCTETHGGTITDLTDERLLISLSSGGLLEGKRPDDIALEINQEIKFAYLPMVALEYEFTPIYGQLFCFEILD